MFSLLGLTLFGWGNNSFFSPENNTQCYMHSAVLKAEIAAPVINVQCFSEG